MPVGWLVIAGALLGAGALDAAVLCTAKNGTVKLRDSACKRKERPLDPVAAGLQGPPGPKGVDGAPNTTTLVAYAEIPQSNLDTLDVFEIPGFGKLVIQSGGCSTLTAAQAAAPAWVNTTTTDQDVFTFNFGRSSAGPDPIYALAAPGAETSLQLVLGANGYLTFRVRQRTSAAQATIDVFFANGGNAGSVCKVTAHAVVTAA